MRRTLRATVMVLLLTCTAYAGEIPNGAPAPPPPSSTNGVVVMEGEIQNGQDIEGRVADVTLSLVQGVLALF